MLSKRGQFFILAAVILAGIIISLGATTNYARVNREPENFYDFSYEVSKESGVVLDYQIYTFASNDEDLETFVDLLAKDVRDNDPDANMIFVYGSTDGMKLRNYGAQSVGAGEEEVEGGGTSIINTITICSSASQCSSVDTSVYFEDFEDEWVEQIPINSDSDSIDLEISGQTYNFPVSEHKQVIFILQKEVDDENFIAVE